MRDEYVEEDEEEEEDEDEDDEEDEEEDEMSLWGWCQLIQRFALRTFSLRRPFRVVRQPWMLASPPQMPPEPATTNRMPCKLCKPCKLPTRQPARQPHTRRQSTMPGWAVLRAASLVGAMRRRNLA